MRSPFHMLLVYLSVFDIIYLLTSQAIFGFPTISRWYEHYIYPVILGPNSIEKNLGSILALKNFTEKMPKTGCLDMSQNQNGILIP